MLTSQDTAERAMEGLSFDDEWWVQDLLAAMEEQYAQAMGQEDREELPVLLPSMPFSTPRQAANPHFSAPIPQTPPFNQDQDTDDLLRQVSERLATVAVSSPVVPEPRPQKPKLSIITDFSEDYLKGFNPETQLTDDRVSDRLATVAEPSPHAPPFNRDQDTEGLLRQVTERLATVAESSPVASKPKLSKPKLSIITNFPEDYPKVFSFEAQLTEDKQQAAPGLILTRPRAIRQTSIRFDSPETAEPSRAPRRKRAVFPKETYPRAKKSKSLRFADKPFRVARMVRYERVSRRRALVHYAAEHFQYPKTFHPLSDWLKSLSAPTEASSDSHASVILPLLQRPQEDGSKPRLKSRPQTQVSFAVAVGKAAVGVLFAAALYFALDRATEPLVFAAALYFALHGATEPPVAVECLHHWY